MKKYIYNNVQVLIAAALTLSGAFSSCRDHDFDFDEHRYGTQEQIYNKTFTDTFGEIDPEHTWIPFVDANFTVSVSQPSDIKVFDCNGQLVAHREDVSGTQTIEFDVPRGENNIIVLQNDIYAVEAMVGENVSFEGTRAQRYPSTADVTINYPEDFKEGMVNKSHIEYIRGTLLPNDKDNSTKDGLTKDFSFVSNGGTFTIYPVYWNTGATLECGVYYKNSNGELVHVPFYMNKTDNDRLQGYINGILDKSWKTIADDYDDTFYGKSNAGVRWEFESFRTRGIEITLEEGVAFGLYISQNGKYFHSKKEDNDCGHVHAVQFSYGGKEYFSFEDWENKRFSLNDIIFTIENKPRVLDYGAVGFTMAFEDMGSIGDFDFNDVVLQVEREDGKQEGNITLAAAGATYYIEVLYNGNVIDWGGGAKEVHEAFGVDRKTMVNTGKGEYKQPKVIKKNFGDVRTRSDIAKNFSLRVYTGDPGDSETKEYNTIQIPNTTEGVAPQGFVVNNLRWSWPNERQSILDKYPAFLNWVQNQQNTHWYEPESPIGGN